MIIPNQDEQISLFKKKFDCIIRVQETVTYLLMIFARFQIQGLLNLIIVESLKDALSVGWSHLKQLDTGMEMIYYYILFLLKGLSNETYLLIS